MPATTPIPTYRHALKIADPADLDLIAEWLEDCWLGAGRSRLNGEHYARILTRLSARLAPATLPDATQADVKTFVREASEDLSPSSKSYVIRALKSFFGWFAEEYDSANPAAKLKTPQVPWGEAKVVSTDLHERLVASITSRSMSYWDRRDVAMLQVAASTGLRISEICNMDWETLDLDNQVLHVKVSKTASGIRTVALSKTAIRAIKKMNRIRPGVSRNPTEGPVWISTKGGRLTTTGAGQMLRRRCKAIGEECPGWHAYRRRLLTRLISGDGGTPVPIVLVARSAGWSASTANLMASRYSRGEAQELALEASMRLVGNE